MFLVLSGHLPMVGRGPYMGPGPLALPLYRDRAPAPAPLCTGSPPPCSVQDAAPFTCSNLFSMDLTV